MSQEEKLAFSIGELPNLTGRVFRKVQNLSSVTVSVYLTRPPRARSSSISLISIVTRLVLEKGESDGSTT